MNRPEWYSIIKKSQYCTYTLINLMLLSASVSYPLKKKSVMVTWVISLVSPSPVSFSSLSLSLSRSVLDTQKWHPSSLVLMLCGWGARARSGHAGAAVLGTRRRRTDWDLGAPAWIVCVGGRRWDERQSRWVVRPRERYGAEERNPSKDGRMGSVDAHRKSEQRRPWVH